jgi:hypothetical protein
MLQTHYEGSHEKDVCLMSTSRRCLSFPAVVIISLVRCLIWSASLSGHSTHRESWIIIMMRASIFRFLKTDGDSCTSSWSLSLSIPLQALRFAISWSRVIFVQTYSYLFANREVTWGVDRHVPEAQSGGAVRSAGDMPAMLHFCKRNGIRDPCRIIMNCLQPCDAVLQ